MFQFALNHMSVPGQSYQGLLSIAQSLGCCGVEARNDLAKPLFDGLTPKQAKELTSEHGMRLLTVSEVKQFDVFTDRVKEQAKQLIDIAHESGAEAISLIPANEPNTENLRSTPEALQSSLIEIAHLLQGSGVQGFIEPLGFTSCALRYKRDVLNALNNLGLQNQFKLVHDTFHHVVASEAETFAASTGMVHISGVVASAKTPVQFTDAQRVLVDEKDCLGNVDQLLALSAAGYTGPVSFEAFAPSVHELFNPTEALQASMNYITSVSKANAA